MPLSADVLSALLEFHRSSRFGSRGGVVTDLDGTAVHERDGRVFVAEPVTRGLKALVELGRPVVLNTLRFPLNVIRTFGREWSAITPDPVPLVSLNGAVVGVLTPTDVGETTFDEMAVFTLSDEQLDEVAARLDALLRDGLDDIVLFHYPRDWREGERVWTPREERVGSLREKYGSASVVHAVPLERLRDELHRDGACMLSLVVDIPADRRMAYQHADPSGFLTARGVDKLSGAREAAARLGFDLDQSIGAGDTPMDCFLEGCGLAIQVGPLTLDFQGRMGTIRLGDPSELGEALFHLASFPREPSAPAVEVGERRSAEEGEAESVARTVVERHVGVPTRVSPLSGGISNLAFDVETEDARVAVRLAEDGTKVEGFEREREAADRARAAGVPTQEVVAVGREGRWAYAIARHLAAEPATNHADRLTVLEELGRLARTIHRIPTVGFGHRFAWPGDETHATPPGSTTWAGFLRDELNADARLARLAKLGMISAEQERSLRETLDEVERWDGAPVLNHGDLRLKNVLVDDDARIVAVIDWEWTVSAVGPHWDLSIALHDLSVDAKQALLHGYGLSDEEVRRAAPVWRLFNVLNYVPAIDQLVAANDDEGLERMRTRLSGALDLYVADHATSRR